MTFLCIKWKIHKYTHKYANTQKLSAWKTQHVLYFLKAWDSTISNMTFPYIICKIHKYMNTQICNYTNTKCSKDPICALFLKSTGFMDIKYNIPVYQMWNTQIHKYTNTQIKSALKTQHMLYFWKSLDSRISNMTFPCIKFKIHKHKNMHIIISSYRSI